jgi:hypothetical protein
MGVPLYHVTHLIQRRHQVNTGPQTVIAHWIEALDWSLQAMWFSVLGAIMNGILMNFE